MNSGILSTHCAPSLDARVKPGHDDVYVFSATYVIAGLDPAIQGHMAEPGQHDTAAQNY
jgi:hypothetical protein